MIVTVEHPAHGPLSMVGVNLSRTPGQIRRPAPEFGQHTEEVLREHGFDWADLEELRREGVVRPQTGRPG
jgi:crotonobetainyl-CoA:carnitine CoA-transferase CaiB-like acyl-CoA transferase